MIFERVHDWWENQGDKESNKIILLVNELLFVDNFYGHTTQVEQIIISVVVVGRYLLSEY